VRVLALKKAEDSDEMVLRMVELDGKPANDVHVAFSGPVTAAREITAQEQQIGSATVANGVLVTSFTAYQPKSFALRLGAAPANVTAITSQSVSLNYDLATATNDDSRSVGEGFDGKGDAYPAEILPDHLSYDGVDFNLAHAATGSPNAVIAKGQSVALPTGSFNRVYILAASADGDQAADFRIGKITTPLPIQNWGSFIGQWDTRLWKDATPREWAISAHHAAWPPANLAEHESWPRSPKNLDDYAGLAQGYVKPANVAWYSSHHHTPEGLNEPYQYSYLFAYALDLSASMSQLTLPNNDKIRVLAISVARDNPTITATQPLFDTLQHTQPSARSK